ncbi:MULTISPECIES: D-serine ammonia-lyase [unclassified Jeotgalicoccus]|uniref:D-serine ammonia-lyase n=1 Tax=unclassified Jeotgalicoccus TaxID=2630462 RepID=UPI001414E719|nr:MULTISPECIES: D-serine ammonia-lyase [unclassified Jeotgalicoccus]QQD84629.1 D-serine ammonia-lyase [Jeotgalicoccus sp. ATCC 8456]
MIADKSKKEWIREYPKIQDLIDYKETIWLNDNIKSMDTVTDDLALTEDDILDAEARLKRFAPYIAHVFPETTDQAGIIDSALTELTHMPKALESLFNQKVDGPLYLKQDNLLPISGSVKARGGIYEVLWFAEKIALNAGLISTEDNYIKFDSDDFKTLFSHHELVCGSTGNLGLSIGIIGAKLGFKVTIHMSLDARQWKKDLLREKGVNVVEHEDDYSKAVLQGRQDSLNDPNSYFIDDENSKTLFLGYAVAAIRLKAQLQDQNIKVDKNQPLNVYLPCGVGGGPGGIAFGLKTVFRDSVNCYFVEPTHSPCMLLGMMTDYHDRLSIQDFGLDNLTAADGLAVGRPSGFVGDLLKNLISGISTVSDTHLFEMLTAIYDTESIKLEPSALAGIYGAIQMDKSGTHIAWSTGGDMVPDDVWQDYYEMSKN